MKQRMKTYKSILFLFLIFLRGYLIIMLMQMIFIKNLQMHRKQLNGEKVNQEIIYFQWNKANYLWTIATILNRLIVI